MAALMLEIYWIQYFHGHFKHYFICLYQWHSTLCDTSVIEPSDAWLTSTTKAIVRF